jgi:LPXTG-site transpeptidase (sortase) family protein
MFRNVKKMFNVDSFSSVLRQITKSLFFALILLLFTTNSAKAWDIWLVTNQGRIIVIRDVETLPTQELVVTHASVSDAYNHEFGDIGFAPNGTLYGISMTLGVPSNLYAIDTTTGAIVASANSFDFEWGNALAFDVETGRGYTGGGLESFSPYLLLRRLRYFDHYDPATTSDWYDMTGDYPNGGFAGDFAFANGKAYAIWGIWNGATYEHYLLEITMDSAKNFLSCTNLGQTEPLLGEGIWGLASDGQTLYATSPNALYRVSVVNNTASYTKIVDYALNNGEAVNGATSMWTDLSLTHTVDDPLPTLNGEIILTTTVHNDGPYDASNILAQITLPVGYEYLSHTATAGNYTFAGGQWDIGNLAVGETVTLEITVIVREVGLLESRAEITRAAQGDPDSHPGSSYDVDDIFDGLADDDEGIATVETMPQVLPATGFPRGRISDLPAQPASQTYAATEMLLSIPKLGVSMPIVGVPQSGSGWDVTWLAGNAGYLAGTAFPTWAGNTVITAHVWDAYNQPGPFSDLKMLNYGDQVQIHAWGLTYIYEVRESKLVAVKDTDAVFQSEEYDWLTLLTCEFYNPFTGDYLFRRGVRAVLVDVRE